STSFVDYTSSTQLGTSTSMQNTFTDTQTLTTTETGGITIGIVGGSVSATQTHSFTQTGQTNNTVSVNKMANAQLKVLVPAAPANGLNHDFDVILVWLNPVVNFNLNSITGLGSMQVTGLSFDPADPVNDMDVVALYAGWLKNPSSMPPEVADALDRAWAQP